jgi:disulfide bond formation protein DsbB
MKPTDIAFALGALALALIVGALGFQYIAHMPPCEMCHWQRWPLIAAAFVGILGGLFVKRDAGMAFWLALLVILLVAASGAIGVDQAGVEWKWWEGPQACTGKLMGFHGLDDLNVPGQVRCDLPSFRLFGLSLAGYNAIISLGSALIGLVLLLRRPR